jgi:hypothetical protein
MMALREQEESRVREIIAKDEIRDLNYSYLQSIDRCDYDKMRSLYWEDGRDEHGINPSGEVEDFITMIEGYYASAICLQHHLTNLYIKVDGDYAESEGYVVNINLLPGFENVFGGRYLDKYERRGGVWKFIHRRLTAEWIKSKEEGIDNRAAESVTAGMYHGAIDETDPSYAYFRLFKRGER